MLKHRRPEIHDLQTFCVNNNVYGRGRVCRQDYTLVANKIMLESVFKKDMGNLKLN